MFNPTKREVYLQVGLMYMIIGPSLLAVTALPFLIRIVCPCQENLK